MLHFAIKMRTKLTQMRTANDLRFEKWEIIEKSISDNPKKTIKQEKRRDKAHKLEQSSSKIQVNYQATPI